MNITASTLRGNIYKILDQVIDTGDVLRVERKNGVVEIAPVKVNKGKLDNLTKHDCIVGNPDSIVHLDWSNEWKGEIYK